MLKKIKSSAVSLVCIIALCFTILPTSNVLAAEKNNSKPSKDKEYREETIYDFSDLDLQIENNEYVVKNKNKKVDKHIQKELDRLNAKMKKDSAFLNKQNQIAKDHKLYKSKTIKMYVTEDLSKGISHISTESEVAKLKEELKKANIDLNTASTESIVWNFRGKALPGSTGFLTIRLYVYEAVGSDKPVEYLLRGSFDWADWNWNGDDSPAIGYDFAGFAWGGEFNYRNHPMMNGWYDGTGDPIQFSVAKAEDKKCYVWKFKELDSGLSNRTSSGEGEVRIYKTALDNSETAVCFKYIHTFREFAAQITVQAGKDGLNGGFTIGEIPGSWETICTFSELLN